MSDGKQQFVCDTHLQTHETLTLEVGSPLQVALHVAISQFLAKVSYDIILTTLYLLEQTKT